MLGTWCLAALVLVNAYSSLLISSLAIPKLMPAPQGYSDLALNPAHKNLGSILEKNSNGFSQNSVINYYHTLYIV